MYTQASRLNCKGGRFWNISKELLLNMYKNITNGLVVV